jgi:hypothetical protein
MSIKRIFVHYLVDNCGLRYVIILQLKSYRQDGDITKSHMKQIIAAAITTLLMTTPALGAAITVEFDVTINKRYVGYGPADGAFEPITHQYASLTFDNVLYGVFRNWDTYTLPINTLVRTDFGSPDTTVIESPLSAFVGVNPLPDAPTVSHSSVSSFLAYSIPPEGGPAQFSHWLSASATTSSRVAYPDPWSYPGASWTRGTYLGAWLGYRGPIERETYDSHTFTSTDLMAYLTTMDRIGGAFSFSDQYYYEERPSLFYDHLRYEGTAVITRIIDSEASAVPEPTSTVLFTLGLSGLFLVGRRRFSQRQSGGV